MLAQGKREKTARRKGKGKGRPRHKGKGKGHPRRFARNLTRPSTARTHVRTHGTTRNGFPVGLIPTTSDIIYIYIYIYTYTSIYAFICIFMQATQIFGCPINNVVFVINTNDVTHYSHTYPPGKTFVIEGLNDKGILLLFNSY